VEKSGEICVGSDEEVEISAATAVCVESLVEEKVTGLGQKINAIQKEIVIDKGRATLELDGGLKPSRKSKLNSI